MNSHMEPSTVRSGKYISNMWELKSILKIKRKKEERTIKRQNKSHEGRCATETEELAR